MRTYETLFIINPNINDVEEIVSNVRSYIESNGYNVIKVDLWGKRTLAYEVKKYTEGYYVLIIFQSEPDFVSQLQNYFGISGENIIRYIVVKFEGDLDKIRDSEDSEHSSEE